MENYMNLLKDYLKERRNMSKKVFYLMGRVYRGITNNKFSFEQVENELFNQK